MKVLALPGDPNPYQGLLYSAMPADVVVRIPSRTRWLFLTHVFVLIVSRLRGHRIVHLHWLYFLTVPAPIPDGLRLRLNGFNHWLFLAAVKVLRFRLVWTVHNVLPHEKQTYDDVRWLRRFAAAADVAIVHSDATTLAMRGFGAEPAHVEKIPHGNYRGVYPELVSRAEARASLGIDADETVVLFFGAIKKYKGVESLIRAFSEVGRDRARLLIVGQSKDDELSGRITSGVAEDARIDLHSRFVEDSEVAGFFLAADFVGLPFTAVSTSGSAILAMTFGKPIVGPLLGDLRELPDGVGVFYEATDETGLARSLSALIGDADEIMSKSESAREFAATLDWSTIAIRTAAVYRLALDSSR